MQALRTHPEASRESQFDIATPGWDRSCMSRGRRWALALLPLLLSACSEPVSRAPERLNFVLIIGDDHGYGDFGFMGSEWVRTPNLDRLASEGTLFTHAYNAASECLHSLNTLLTGMYPRQFAFRASELRRAAGYPPIETTAPAPTRSFSERAQRRNQERVLDELRIGERFAIEEFDTLPRLLARHGYASFQAGKYFEGTYRTAGFTAGMTDPYEPERFSGGRGLSLGRESMEDVYAFIDAHRNDQFFLWFAPMLPHIPHSAPDRFLAQYADKGLSPAAIRYYASCTWFDQLVGELVGFLEERNLRERTILVYLADNGWVQGPHDSPDRRDERFLGGASGKGSLLEPGLRTPIIVNLPGRIPAGRVSEALVSSVDITPTLLDYASADLPSELPGISLRPLIDGESIATRSILIGGMNALRPPADSSRANVGPFLEPEVGFYARTADWHFISYEDRGTRVLYDARSDPHGHRDLASDRPDVVAELLAEIEHWKRETHALPES
jgi:arylsulfatase A-like enzyme